MFLYHFLKGACSEGKRKNYLDSKNFCMIGSSNEFINNNTLNTNIPNLNTITNKYSDFFYEDSMDLKDPNVNFYLEKFFKEYNLKDLKDRKDFNYLKEKDKNLYNLLINSNFNSNNNTNEKINNLIYLESNLYETDCQIYEDFDNTLIIIIILVPIFYVFLVIYLCVVYLRYRKIYTQYSRLKDEKELENSQGPNNNHNNDQNEINNKIELGNISSN